jgi:hypothetical protein
VDAVTGFIEQMNEELAMLSPATAIAVLVDSAVKAGFRFFGANPGPTLREQMFRSAFTVADRRSEDYATGELAGVCVGTIGTLGIGFAGGVAASRLAAQEAATLARQGRIAERLASMQRPSASLQEAAAAARNAGRRYVTEFKEEVVDLVKGWQTGGGGGRGSGRF